MPQGTLPWQPQQHSAACSILPRVVVGGATPGPADCRPSFTLPHPRLCALSSAPPLLPPQTVAGLWQLVSDIVDLRPPHSGAAAAAAAGGLGPAAPGESATAHHCLVAQGVSEELDDKRHLYDGLPDLLSEVAAQEAERIPPQLAAWRSPLVEPSISIVYLPKARRLWRAVQSRPLLSPTPIPPAALVAASAAVRIAATLCWRYFAR